MSDNINITDQVNVSVVPNTTNITVCTIGVQGPAGANATGEISVSISGYVTSGDIYIISGSLFEQIQNTSGALADQIQASTAGVSTINGQSGNVSILGTGNVQVTTSAQTITISGTGDYYPRTDEQRIRTLIPSGSGELIVNFNYSYQTPPVVWSHIQNSTENNIIYYVNATVVDPDKYKVIFSDTITETGFYLNSLIKNV